MSIKRELGIIAPALLAVLCIVFVQFFWLKNLWDSGKRQFEEKAHIALTRVAENISEITNVQLPSLNLINKVSSNYYIVNINETIDANNLEFYLKKEFERINLRTPFEYGIYDCQNDNMVYGNYIDQDFETQSQPDNTLPTYDEYIYYFGIRFPNKNNYIYTAGWIPILMSATLFFSIFFLIYAILEVFNQKKLSQMQKAFINNLAHELRTPLSSIKIGTEVLIENINIKKDERAAKYVEIINQQSKILEEQVNRTLNIAKTGSQYFQIKKTKFSINACIHDVAQQLKTRFQLKENHISVISIKDFMISADKFHFTNVIKNLLENAIKYDPKRKPITLRIEESKNFIILSIKDKGIGIDKKSLKLLGKQFFRIREDNIQKSDGFGLGLYYVRNIISAHHWHMNIESKRNAGTTITIKIANEM